MLILIVFVNGLSYLYICGKDKTKYILFKKGNKKYSALNITRNKNKIKQYSVVEYFGCLLDENMSGESMARRTLKK